MKVTVTKEVAAMRRMSVRQLRGRYVNVFGEQARPRPDCLAGEMNKCLPVFSET